MQQRNLLLDILKGIAILAVILYHLGVLTYGYLGVEVFLVIGGYLITKSMLRSNDNYWTYINKRLVRLWPLLLLVSAIALVFGWLWMLPIHYKLNCEAVIGTGTFSNNIIQYITCGNYWMADNGYKPLMHTWYVGIMMQFYLIYPIVFITSKKLTKDWVYSSFMTLAVVFALSLGLFLSEYLSTEQNFYFLPSRLFEFATGGMVALYYNMKVEGKRRQSLVWITALVVVMTLMLLSNVELDAKKMRLLITVSISTVFVIMAENDFRFKRQAVFKPIALCGTASFSLYLFHQPVFAFYRYAYSGRFSILSYTIIIICALVVGFISFYLLEQPLGKFVRGNMKRTSLVNGICIIFFGGISICALYYYRQNGIIRDVPELGIYVNGNHAYPEEYNDKPYEYDHDFEDNGRSNILVIGDSFGRYWINILKESGIGNTMNISYHVDPDDICIDRIKKADYVFIANRGFLSDKYSTIIPLVSQKRFYRVGNKSYGPYIGNIYNNDRYGKNYYSQKVSERTDSKEISEKEVILFGDRFINMMSPLKDENGMINIFYKGKLITQDGIHLTKAGAQMYARILNVKQYFAE